MSKAKAKQRVYSWKPGRALRGLTPRAAGEELERIMGTNGGSLTAEVVVSSAKEDTSPLHGCFEWDNDVAAHQHRLNQARAIITSVVVTDRGESRIPPAPLVVNVTTPETGRCYMPTVQVFSDDDMRARAFQEVKKQLETLRRKYAQYEDICNAIDGVLEKVA